MFRHTLLYAGHRPTLSWLISPVHGAPTRGRWLLMAFSALSPHLFLLFISTPPGILPSLCGPIPNVIAPPPLQHNPLTSPPLLPQYGRTSSMFKRMAVLPRTFVKRPPAHILEEDAEPNEDLAGNDFTNSQDTTTTFQELLKLIDSNTRELPSVLSPKHYAALTQLPLTPVGTPGTGPQGTPPLLWPPPDHVPHCQSRAG